MINMTDYNEISAFHYWISGALNTLMASVSVK